MPVPTQRVTPMWLAHHYPDAYDRCRVVAGRHVCRRCLVLYPVAFVAMGLALAGWWWPRSLDPVLLAVLPLPAVVEFVAEHLHRATYRPRRQVLVSVPLALALGAGLARYLEDQTDPLFWAMVLVHGGICGLAVLWSWFGPSPSPGDADGS